MENPLRIVRKQENRGLRSGVQGVTIVEALVALVVLSFGLYGAAELVQASRKNGHMASLRAQAAGLGALKLEEIRLAGPSLVSELAKLPPGAALTLPADGETTTIPQNPRFSFSAEIRRVQESGLVSVRVSVQPTAATSGLDLPVIVEGVASLPRLLESASGGQQ
jgi:type II secretory pathway pseudopilin PulG